MNKQSKVGDPHPDLVKNLISNKIQCYARKEGRDTLLMCNFKEKVKQQPNQSLEVWGRSQKVVELISTTVFHFYPKAEVTSQTGTSIVYKLNA